MELSGTTTLLVVTDREGGHMGATEGKSIYRLFMCQDENEPEDQSLRLFWIMPVTTIQALSAMIH